MNERFLCRGKRLDTGDWVQGYYDLLPRDDEDKSSEDITFIKERVYNRASHVQCHAVDPATVEPVAVKVIISNSFEVSCPNCQTMVGDKDNYLYDDFPNYCPDCGRRLDWRIGGDGE